MSTTAIRDRGEQPQGYDCVIRPDVTPEHSRNNSYQIWTYDEHVANVRSLPEAKKFVEDVYGPLAWKKLPGDTKAHFDRVWGYTDEFNSPKWYLVVQHLPRLGSRRPFTDGLARWTD